jgi:hypothetical protein
VKQPITVRKQVSFLAHLHSYLFLHCEISVSVQLNLTVLNNLNLKHDTSTLINYFVLNQISSFNSLMAENWLAEESSVFSLLRLLP